MRNQRSHWPKVIQTRRGDAGNQTRAFKSRDLGWCSYLNPRLTTGSLRHVHPSAFVFPVPSTRPGPKWRKVCWTSKLRGLWRAQAHPLTLWSISQSKETHNDTSRHFLALGTFITACSTWCILTHLILTTSEVGAIILLTLKSRKMRLRRVKGLAQSHTAKV